MPKEWKKPKPTEGQRAKAASDAKKTIARNKKARHDYTIEDTWEAGLALMGTEVKALRMGRASLVDAWVEINGGEAWLYGANIAGLVDEPRAYAQAQAAAAPRGDCPHAGPRGREGLHDRAPGAVLHRGPRQGRNRPG